MICHKKKLIFVHIPKCGGSSLNKFYFHKNHLDWKIPNYELLYGWCPDRKIHLQHATSKQLIETGLVTKEQWEEYFKFTFVRNPWDRAYSDFLWIKNDCKVDGDFEDYLNAEKEFEPFLSTLSKNKMSYRGDHLLAQLDFFTLNGDYNMDFVGRFENYNEEVLRLNTILGINQNFSLHEKKNKSRARHYSFFYNEYKRKIVADVYQNDIEQLGYQFEKKKNDLGVLKRIIRTIIKQ